MTRLLDTVASRLSDRFIASVVVVVVVAGLVILGIVVSAFVTGREVDAWIIKIPRNQTAEERACGIARDDLAVLKTQPGDLLAAAREELAANYREISNTRTACLAAVVAQPELAQSGCEPTVPNPAPRLLAFSTGTSTVPEIRWGSSRFHREVLARLVNEREPIQAKLDALVSQRQQALEKQQQRADRLCQQGE